MNTHMSAKETGDGLARRRRNLSCDQFLAPGGGRRANLARVSTVCGYLEPPQCFVAAPFWHDSRSRRVLLTNLDLVNGFAARAVNHEFDEASILDDCAPAKASALLRHFLVEREVDAPQAVLVTGRDLGEVGEQAPTGTSKVGPKERRVFAGERLERKKEVLIEVEDRGRNAGVPYGPAPEFVELICVEDRGRIVCVPWCWAPKPGWRAPEPAALRPSGCRRTVEIRLSGNGNAGDSEGLLGKGT